MRPGREPVAPAARRVRERRRFIVVCTAALVAAVAFVVLAVLVRSTWGPLHRLDVDTVRRLNRYLATHRSQAPPWQDVTTAGGPVTFRVAASVVAVLLWVRSRRRAALFVALSMIVAAVLSAVAKTLVHRTRPAVAVMFTHASGKSFPSGHALASVVGVSVLLTVLRPMINRAWSIVAGVAGLLVVIAVGFSRVILGVHYVSDVLGGWLIGCALVLTGIAVFRPATDPPADPPRDGYAEP